jgi:hypothetical protein
MTKEFETKVREYLREKGYVDWDGEMPRLVRDMAEFAEDFGEKVEKYEKFLATAFAIVGYDFEIGLLKDGTDRWVIVEPRRTVNPPYDTVLEAFEALKQEQG